MYELVIDMLFPLTLISCVHVASHKELFFSMGVVDSAIHVLRISTASHVQYKAIGLMRLLTENQGLTVLALRLALG
jgi:hypothetical protein